eukprot:5656273-Amphidinium_carterae.2
MPEHPKVPRQLQQSFFLQSLPKERSRAHNTPSGIVPMWLPQGLRFVRFHSPLGLRIASRHFQPG